jgi:hypothetical protein
VNSKFFRRASSFATRFSVLTAVICTGCDFFSSRFETVVRWPAENTWAADFCAAEPDFWELSWLEYDGSVSRSRVPGDRPAVLKLAKESPVIISAVPVTPGFGAGFQFRPAGIVRPCDLPVEDEMRLTWEEGFTAGIMLTLAESGVHPSRVNLRRFLDTAAERGGPNPWKLDTRRLFEDLAAGRLWVYSFRLSPQFTVELPLPPGTWYSEYPRDPVLVSDASGWQGELPEGQSRFIRDSGDLVLTVGVDERGGFVMLMEP